jgi:hypothetical protein
VRALAALLLAASAAGVPAAEAEELGADAGCTRVAEALRVAAPMSARAQVTVRRPGEPDWIFDLEMLRQPHRDGTRTVFEMREAGDARSVVSELVVAPGEPLVNWYWDIQKRRWLAVRGLQVTDRFAETLFRYEDLWLADPSARRSGAVRRVEEEGRGWLLLESAPYHYYLRVETRVDPATSLPQRIRFIDNTGAPIREQHFEAVETVDGRPFPKRVRLRDLVTREESTIVYGDVQFDAEIPSSFFDLSTLHDRITRGVDPVPLDVVRERRDAGGT